MRGVGWRLVVAAAAGALTVLAFAPFGAFVIPLLSFGALAAICVRAARVREAMACGFAFGMGLFLAGVSWIYVSLHDQGGMPAPLAILAVVLFAMLLASFALPAMWVFARFRSGIPWRDAMLFAAAWTIAEWLRGWVMTGFPWLSIGYTQTPPSPLAGLAPVLGVYGVGFVVVALAAYAGLVPRTRVGWARAVVAVLVACRLGAGVMRIDWVQPRGPEIDVALLQPNIPQSLKWQPELLGRWLRENLELVEANPARIMVLPETTLPLPVDMLPQEYLDSLESAARKAGGDVLFGVFLREPTPDGARYYNSALSLGVAPSQRYSKSHLVAFGEFSPPGLAWVYNWLRIPMSDQTRGPQGQAPLELAGEQIAVNICYEDAFGAEIAQSLPRAGVLLNLTNTAWFGRSLAQPQHLQMSQMRALEAGRPMLRSTNTGVTAAVGVDGRIQAELPQFERGALRVRVRAYEGLTPFARWANAPAIGFAFAVLAFSGLMRRRRG